jgi:hypothetical protein
VDLGVAIDVSAELVLYGPYRDLTVFSSDASNVVKALSPRQDESEPINGCGARCYACGEGGSGGSCSRRVKRDIGAELFWHPLEDADTAIGNASSGVDSGHLHTRALDDLSGASENDIATYLARRQTESGAFDLNTADDNSLTRQFEFSTRRRGLIIGFTRSGYLTGCTVLTVVSRRAVCESINNAALMIQMTDENANCRYGSFLAEPWIQKLCFSSRRPGGC